MRTHLIATLALVGMLAAPATSLRAATPADGALPASGGGPSFLVSPLLWFLGTLGVPVENISPLPNSEALEREQGWRDLVLGVRDEGEGVYLEVQGRIQFDSAEIRLGDGTTRTVDLDHAVRGHGLYLLKDLGGMTAVDAVLLRACARSGEARVGVRLGR